MSHADFGVIGLAVMGSNLARNIESRGYTTSVYNRTTSVTDEFMQQFGTGKFIGAHSLQDFVNSLARPRKMIIMVKAGGPTDAVIQSVVPLLEAGDIVIDGGNADFRDTNRRAKECAKTGVRFFGMGISGGEEGALKGPSLMPGGDPSAWKEVQPIVENISAKVNGEPCVTYIGPEGSGHFVKMVHNGIEYGDMQLIAEAYDLLHRAAGLKPIEAAQVFERWNSGPLSSFLIEITAKVLAKKDSETGQPMVDVILDKAGQKGTGKWTVQNALDLGVPAPTLAAAVDARGLSSLHDDRQRASELFPEPKGAHTPSAAESEQFIRLVHDALYAGKILSYAQGMAILRAASLEFNWGLNLSAISSIWRGGCIIRAAFLEEIRRAYDTDANLANLIFSPSIRNALSESIDALRSVVGTAVQLGIPVPALSASLYYFDSYRTARLPQNLTQAQRDFFGAHTFERTDKPGVFHVEWE